MEEELIKLGLLNAEEVKKQNPELPLYKKYFMRLILLKIVIFFMYYTYIFSTSLFLYYISIITTLFAASKFILSFYFLIFFAISILFYIVGFIMFVDELIKEKVYKKIS